MEFSSRVACIKYYQEEYPNLPRYMIEMALDYDLSNGGTSNEKPLTGKQKRKQKQMKKKVEKRDTGVQDLIQDAVNSGKPIEIDSVGIVRKEDYVMPPFVKGYISVEGLVPPEPEPEPEPEAAEKQED
jgi:hypothetical protein